MERGTGDDNYLLAVGTNGAHRLAERLLFQAVKIISRDAEGVDPGIEGGTHKVRPTDPVGAKGDLGHLKTRAPEGAVAYPESSGR